MLEVGGALRSRRKDKINRTKQKSHTEITGTAEARAAEAAGKKLKVKG
jgi:hypothetical protein